MCDPCGKVAKVGMTEVRGMRQTELRRSPLRRKPMRRRRIDATIRRLVPLGGPCAYCGKARAIHRDHVVPAALRRKHPGFDTAEWIVGACAPCNLRKATFRFVPASHAHRLGELPGVKPWRVWDGGAL